MFLFLFFIIKNAFFMIKKRLVFLYSDNTSITPLSMLFIALLKYKGSGNTPLVRVIPVIPFFVILSIPHENNCLRWWLAPLKVSAATRSLKRYSATIYLLIAPNDMVGIVQCRYYPKCGIMPFCSLNGWLVASIFILEMFNKLAHM